MWKFWFIVCFLFSANSICAQNEVLAQSFFERGEFEKALMAYQELTQKQPHHSTYFQRLVECHQQLERFDEAQRLLQERFGKQKSPNFLVELGYNQQLQNNITTARQYYDQAIDRVREQHNMVYNVATTFERKVLIDYALKTYEIALEKNPDYNFNYQMGLLYGQSGNTELMIHKLLDEIVRNPQNSSMIQNQFARFIANDANMTFQDELRKSLLVRVQKDQDLLWNHLLSWLFVQQKDYAKAFVQEKAIHRREPGNFSNILNLAQLVLDEDNVPLAKEMLEFILNNTNDHELKIFANTELVSIDIENATAKDFPQLDNRFEQLFQTFGKHRNTLQLQLTYARYVTFKREQPALGRATLEDTMKLQLNPHEQSEVKMELADILLYEEKFNQALLMYTQIEDAMKNDVIGHEATLRTAKTSYYKGDFDWALSQLKVLKTASTQLIANDAIELYLLINDNVMADSTRKALTEFSKADYLLFKNKNREAAEVLKGIIKTYPDNSIIDITYLRLGQLYEKEMLYQEAVTMYEKLLSSFPESIYRDEALTFAGKLYSDKLNQIEEAQKLFEEVIYKHQDSIYYVEARRRYRDLRGDVNL